MTLTDYFRYKDEFLNHFDTPDFSIKTDSEYIMAFDKEQDFVVVLNRKTSHLHMSYEIDDEIFFESYNLHDKSFSENANTIIETINIKKTHRLFSNNS